MKKNHQMSNSNLNTTTTISSPSLYSSNPTSTSTSTSNPTTNPSSNPNSSSSSASLSSIASAFDLAGHSIFLSNPHRLSILSVHLDSSVTLTASSSNGSTNEALQPTFPSSFNSTSNSQQINNHSNYQYPISDSLQVPNSHSYASTSQSSHPPSSSSNGNINGNGNGNGITGRFRSGSRPKSADIGARAREALMEIGRAARGVAAGSVQGTTGSGNGTASIEQINQHLNPSTIEQGTSAASNAGRTTTFQGGTAAPKQPTIQPIQTSHLNSAEFNSNHHHQQQEPSLTISSEIVVKPQSFTFGRDSRLTSCSIPLDISSSLKLHGRGGLDSSDFLTDHHQNQDQDQDFDSDSGSDSSVISPSIEFVGDPNPISSTNFKLSNSSNHQSNNGANANGRAGTFVPFPDCATVSSRSSGESDRDLQPIKNRKKNPNRAPFDPNRLLLKVSPPSDSTSRRTWSKARGNQNHLNRLPIKVERELKLSFRLRLAASASADDANSSQSQSASRRGGFVSNDKGLGEVVFLTSDSPEQIINAVAQGTSSDSVLSSEQIAKLEGITRIVVNPRTEAGVSARGARETEFEWKWNSLRRKKGKGNVGGKCCCAFIELDPNSGKGSILSAFTFWVEMPSSSDTEWNSNSTPMQQPLSNLPNKHFSETERKRGSRPETPALMAALSNNRSDLFLNAGSSPPTSFPRTSWRKTTFSSPNEPLGYLSKRRSASDGKHYSHLQLNGNSDQEFPSSSSYSYPSSKLPSNSVGKALKELQLNLNHTELSLSESYSDSPILRAAITNLERRTASIKKSCKSSLKAFNELKSQIISMEVSQNSLDDAFNDLGNNHFNSSLEFLNKWFLLGIRGKNSKYRVQELDEIEKWFEKPLGIVLEKCREVQEQIKNFESESKSYYSQTQKWLANNKDSSVSSSSNSNSNSNSNTNNGNNHNSSGNVSNEIDEKLAKLERNDEKQKLRQLKFDYVRVDLYKSLLELHGGEIELTILNSLLNLSEFYSNQPKEIWGTSNIDSFNENQSILESIRSQGKSEGKRIENDLNETLIVLKELSEKILISENGLNEIKDGVKESNASSTWDLLGLHPSESAEQAIQTSAPTRQTGHRIKHLLTSLGMAGSGSSSSSSASNHQQPTSPSPAQGEMSTSASTSTIGSPVKPPQQGLRKKVSLKLKSRDGGVVEKAAGITSPVFGAFNRFRGVEGGPLSPSKANLNPLSSNLTSSFQSHPSSEAINIPPPVTRSPRMGGGTALMDFAPESPNRERSMGHQTTGSPTTRRSNSHGAYGSASPQTRMMELAAIASGQGSPRTRRGIHGRSPSLSRSSSDGYAPMETSRTNAISNPKRASHGLGLGGVGALVSEPTSNLTSAPPPSHPRFGASNSPLSLPSAANTGRKKEGILWVMSKAIVGAGGADAPRAANRTNAWKESWVVLSGSGHLGEYADWKDAKILSPSSPLIDLRFATVREARGVDRRFCFEIVTRENRRLFQASDDISMKDWINCISKAIESLINGTSSVRQIDKVARSSEKGGGLGLSLGGVSPRMDSGDWGTGGGLRAFGDSNSSNSGNSSALDQRSSGGWQISQSKAFSQSLTDLSSAASGAGRFFSRNSDSNPSGDGLTSYSSGQKAGKRDSRNASLLNNKSAHLSTLSESHARTEIGQDSSNPDSLNFLSTPMKVDSSTSISDVIRSIKHERGISNKTPVSGYVDQQSPRMSTNLNLNGNSNQKSPDVEIHIRDESESTENSDFEFDRRIEELVHSNYGSRIETSSSELVLPLSVSPTSSNDGFKRMRKSSNNSQFKHGRNHSVSSSSNTEIFTGISSRSRSQSQHQFQHQSSSQDSRKQIRSKEARAFEIQEIVSRKGNNRCADCGELDPRWSSWSLSSSPCCIFICISCSGIHRSLGVQISKVKSVDLDDWTEEQIQSAKLWGNEKANSFWENTRGIEFPKGPRNGSDGNGNGNGNNGGKEFWLIKYVEQRWKAEGTLEDWINELNSNSTSNQDEDEELDKTLTISFDSTLTLADQQHQHQNQNQNLSQRINNTLHVRNPENRFLGRNSSDLDGDTAPVSRDISRSSSKGAEKNERMRE